MKTIVLAIGVCLLFFIQGCGKKSNAAAVKIPDIDAVRVSGEALN